MIAIPKKINNCPIKDAVIEIRFNTNIPKQAVFGVLFNSLGKHFKGEPETLPIRQLPDPILYSDKSLEYKTHFKMSLRDGYSCQIGPKVFLISSSIPYPGWSSYSEIAGELINDLLHSGIIDRVLRLGSRYINVFDSNIFCQIRGGLEIPNIFDPKKNPANIGTVIERKEAGAYISIKNDVGNENDSTQKNSVIDIDVHRLYNNDGFRVRFRSELTEVREVERTLFFELLSPEFIKTLDPVYE